MDVSSNFAGTSLGTEQFTNGYRNYPSANPSTSKNKNQLINLKTFWWRQSVPFIWNRYETIVTLLKSRRWTSGNSGFWSLSIFVSSLDSTFPKKVDGFATHHLLFFIIVAFFSGQILEFRFDIRWKQFVSIPPPLLHSSEKQVFNFTYFFLEFPKPSVQRAITLALIAPKS